ncbi:hypothetical protein D3C84_964520 [compost metagenome]
MRGARLERPEHTASIDASTIVETANELPPIVRKSKLKTGFATNVVERANSCEQLRVRGAHQDCAIAFQPAVRGYVVVRNHFQVAGLMASEE